jgi:hypothetical protein
MLTGGADPKRAGHAFLSYATICTKRTTVEYISPLDQSSLVVLKPGVSPVTQLLLC